AVGFLLSIYLQYAKELDPAQAGLILVSQPVVMTIFSPLAGRLSDKIEARIVASSGMALTFLSILFFIFLTEETAAGLIIINLIILGLGLAFFSSPNTNAAMSAVESKFYGVASATLGTMRLTGQMLGMGIAMLIFALYLGNVRITPENHSQFLASMKTAFTAFAVLCFIGILASLARGKKQ
ncbi:MFS transporter, partial [Candidatus Desantisbacteria bacterium CG_4_9_14_3_um_filter_40_11]